MAEKLGFKTPGLFFQPADQVKQNYQPPGLQQDPNMVAAQAQIHVNQHLAQAEMALNAQKAQADGKRKQDELALSLMLDKPTGAHAPA